MTLTSAVLYNCESDYRRQLYYENFDDGNKFKWYELDGVWSVSGNKLAQTGVLSYPAVNYVAASDEFNDISVEVEINTPVYDEDEYEHASAGLVFRMEGQKNFYAYIVSPTNSYFAYYNGTWWSAGNHFADVDDDPSLGLEKAPVVIIEFCDYTKKECKDAETNLKKIRDEYRADVRFVYRDYIYRQRDSKNQLESFENLEKRQNVSRFAQCAFEQGEHKYWHIHDTLLEKNKLFTTDELIQLAVDENLVLSDYFECFNDTDNMLPEILKDSSDGKHFGLLEKALPIIAINGHVLAGPQSYDTLKTIVEDELKKNVRDNNELYGIHTGYNLNTVPKIRVDLKDTTAEAYINDKLVQRTNIIELFGGYVGVLSDKSSAFFDEFRVYSGQCDAEIVSSLPPECSCLSNAIEKVYLPQLTTKDFTFVGEKVKIWNQDNEYWVRLGDQFMNSLYDDCKKFKDRYWGCMVNNSLYLGYKGPSVVTPTPEPTIPPGVAATPITTVTPVFCDDYCALMGFQFGTCRSNDDACKRRGEEYYQEGWCPDNYFEDTCCCAKTGAVPVITEVGPVVTEVITPTPAPSPEEELTGLEKIFEEASFKLWINTSVDETIGESYLFKTHFDFTDATLTGNITVPFNKSFFYVIETDRNGNLVQLIPSQFIRDEDYHSTTNIAGTIYTIFPKAKTNDTRYMYLIYYKNKNLDKFDALLNDKLSITKKESDITIKSGSIYWNMKYEEASLIPPLVSDLKADLTKNGHFVDEGEIFSPAYINNSVGALHFIQLGEETIAPVSMLTTNTTINIDTQGDAYIHLIVENMSLASSNSKAVFDWHYEFFSGVPFVRSWIDSKEHSFGPGETLSHIISLEPDNSENVFTSKKSLEGDSLPWILFSSHINRPESSLMVFPHTSNKSISLNIAINENVSIKNQLQGDFVLISQEPLSHPTKIILFPISSRSQLDLSVVNLTSTYYFNKEVMGPFDNNSKKEIIVTPKGDSEKPKDIVKSDLDYISILEQLVETGSKTCGPNADWSCKIPELQGWTMLGYANAFAVLEKFTYIIYLNKLSSEPLDSCGEDNSYQCKTALDQGMYMLGLATIYKVTEEELYLDALAKHADVGSEECGPQKGEWACTSAVGHGWMMLGYGAAYAVTGKAKYKSYLAKLADSGAKACGPPDKANCGEAVDQAAIMLGYSYAYNLTKNEDYSTFIVKMAKEGSSAATSFAETCGPKDDWDCGDPESQALSMLAYGSVFELTQDDSLLDSIKSLADTGTETCGIPTGNNCLSAGKQGMMILGYLETYRTTGDEKYLDFAKKLAGTATSGCNYNQPECEHPYDQSKYILAFSSLLNQEQPVMSLFLPCYFAACTAETSGGLNFIYIGVGIVGIVFLFVIFLVISKLRGQDDEDEDEYDEYEEYQEEQWETEDTPYDTQEEIIEEQEESQDEEEELFNLVPENEEDVMMLDEDEEGSKKKIVRTQTDDDAEKVRLILEEISDWIKVERVLTLNKNAEDVHEIIEKHFKEYTEVVDKVDEQTFETVGLYKRKNLVFHYLLSDIDEDSCEIHFMVFGRDQRIVEGILQSVYKKFVS